MWSRYRKVLGIAVAGLLAVGVLGAGSLVAGTALADPGGPQGGGKHERYAQVFLDKLAALLNVDRDTLVGSMKQAGQQTVDEAVANGDLTQEQADRLKSRIESGNFFFHGGREGRGHHGGMKGMMGIVDHQAVKAAVAQRLGLTEEQLRDELRSGKTLEQVATEQGVSMEDLRQTVLDTVQPQLDEAVQEGRITEAQRDRILEHIRTADGMGGMGHPGGKGHRGMDRGNQGSNQSFRGMWFGGSAS